MNAHARLAEIKPIDPLGIGAEVRVVNGERMQLLHQRVKVGQGVGEHSHDNEQICFLLAGRVRADIGGQVVEAAAGDVLVIPGSVKHEIVVLEALEMVEVFCPPRLTDTTTDERQP